MEYKTEFEYTLEKSREFNLSRLYIDNKMYCTNFALFLVQKTKYLELNNNAYLESCICDLFYSIKNDEYALANLYASILVLKTLAKKDRPLVLRYENLEMFIDDFANYKYKGKKLATYNWFTHKINAYNESFSPLAESTYSVIEENPELLNINQHKYKKKKGPTKSGNKVNK